MPKSMSEYLFMKKEFLRSAKALVTSDPKWLVMAHNIPSRHQTAWSMKARAAVLKRHGLI